MRAEINSLRSALAGVEWRRHEGEAVTAALQGEIVKLHHALTDTAQRRQRADAATAALQSETGVLHQALAQAEERRLEGEAATAALRAQVSSLHGDLAVAREVGRVALASLRIEPAMAPEVPRKTGWLALVLRPFGFRARLPSPSAG
jgi:chromosome segregation ATPase